MAPQMVASACWCALFCFVFCFKTVFCDGTRSTLTREELMNIRATTPEELFPTFLPTALEFLDILVKGALTFAHAVKRRCYVDSRFPIRYGFPSVSLPLTQ
ncbi:hypothetical protein XENOCAPTIV_026768 [Xenoophorus captivus]|uniref:Secreted protein n=1 Tax=Xenoophorus captivus TaxID=1517983 RepID=A0ABV0S8W1_9TELE